MSTLWRSYPLWVCWLHRDDGRRELAALGPHARCERMARKLGGRGLRATAAPLGRITVVERGVMATAPAAARAA